MNLKTKIVLGTMKQHKYFSKSKDLSNFLVYAHQNGIKKIHVSDEYDSYKLLVKSFNNIGNLRFTIILKLAEPRKDFMKFSLKRFNEKITRYQKDFGKNHKYIIQLVNRYQCNNREKYLIYQEEIFEEIKDNVIQLKKEKNIKGFYFFPYHESENKIKKKKFIDGITSYRNIKENYNDSFAIKNNFKMIAMRTLTKNQELRKEKNIKKLILFNLNCSFVKNVIVGANNKLQLDQLLKAC